MTPEGTLTLFPIAGEPTIMAPQDLTVGDNGSLWFTIPAGHRIGKITTQGVMSLFELPLSEFPLNITAGTDDKAWFTIADGLSHIGEIDSSGQEILHDVSSIQVFDVALGHDNNIWFTTALGHTVGKLSDGVIAQYPLPVWVSALDIVKGPGSRMWFIQKMPGDDVHILASVTLDGTIQEYPDIHPVRLVPGRFGDLYVEEAGSVSLLRADGTLSDTVDIGTLPHSHMIRGPEERFWFTDPANSLVGAFVPAGTCPSSSSSASSVSSASSLSSVSSASSASSAGSVCAAVCGDGIVMAPEQCDRGALNSATQPDACRPDCRKDFCGDGVTDTGETCDDGNTDNTDGCSTFCS